MFRTFGIKFLNWLFPVQVDFSEAFTKGEKQVTVNLIEKSNGRFVLFDNKNGTEVASYARARDARRGARRRGLTLA